MKRRCHFVVVVALLSVTFCLSSSSTEDDGAAAPDCSAQVVQLSPCLSFVSGQDTEPSQTCCDALATVLVDNASCICELVGGGKNASMNTGLPSINLTLVKQLPKDCGVQEQVKIDEDRCPGHGNQPLAPPGGLGTMSPPASTATLAPAPSIYAGFVVAVLSTLTASGLMFEYVWP